MALSYSLGKTDLAKRFAWYSRSRHGLFKALRDEPLPLFAAAGVRENETVAEIQEAVVTLRQMTAGG